MSRLLAGIAFLCLAGMPAALGAGEPPMVHVSIPPQAWVVKRVGGDLVRVGTLVSKSQDPHTFDPTPLQVQRLAESKLYFTVGLPFERKLEAKLRGAGAGITFADSSAGVKRRVLREDEAEHDHAGCEQHDGDDPHVWLSTTNLAVMAANVAAALARLAPENAAKYEANRSAFAAAMEALHTRLAGQLEELRGRNFYVYHPAFGYFGDEFGMKQKSVEADGKSPTPRQLAALIARARSDGVKLIVVQPQFGRKTADVVAEAVGASVVAVDPLAEDVAETLTRLAGSVSRSSGGGGARSE